MGDGVEIAPREVAEPRAFVALYWARGGDGDGGDLADGERFVDGVGEFGEEIDFFWGGGETSRVEDFATRAEARDFGFGATDVYTKYHKCSILQTRRVMKEKLAKLGWTGWAIVGLVVVLAVGAMVAANTRGPALEDNREDSSLSGIDASYDDVNDVSSGTNDDHTEEGTDDAPVVSDSAMTGETSEVESLPQTGVVGEEEFEYYLD